jgi:hypothetical protein
MAGSAAHALLAEKPWRALAAPPEVFEVPTMLSDRELALLYWLGRDFADPEKGAIVDAGCFLGGSTAALLAGVRDRPETWTGPPVASFDRFEVEEYTLERYFGSNPAIRVGDSFRPFYDENVRRFDAPHQIFEGDVIEVGWSGEPIHVFFIDILKTWDVNDAVQRSFYPHLIPGQSIIVHQDYGYGFCPWIHIGVELMWDSLRHLDAMPFGSHVFLVEKPLPQAAIETNLAGDLSVEEKLELIDRAISRWDGETRGMIELAKAILIFDTVDQKEAVGYTRDVKARYGIQSVRDCADRTLEYFLGAMPVAAYEAPCVSHRAPETRDLKRPRRTGGLLGRVRRLLGR